jgi:hypothetical protein
MLCFERIKRNKNSLHERDADILAVSNKDKIIIASERNDGFVVNAGLIHFIIAYYGRQLFIMRTAE